MSSVKEVERSPLRIERGQTKYPEVLVRFLVTSAPEAVHALGNLDLLDADLTALFVSVRCPGYLILKIHDLAEALRDAGTPVISGFHTPVEQHCLKPLLRGTQPIVMCPARGLDRMRLPADWREALDAGRLLIVSPFPEHVRRATADTAAERNRFVAVLAARIIVGYAEPGGKTESLAKEVVGWGKCYGSAASSLR